MKPFKIRTSPRSCRVTYKTIIATDNDKDDDDKDDEQKDDHEDHDDKTSVHLFCSLRSKGCDSVS